MLHHAASAMWFVQSDTEQKLNEPDFDQTYPECNDI